MRRLAFSFLLVFLFSGRALALSLDVSDDVIRVNTGFNGTNITVFGMQEIPGDVVVIVEGPHKSIIMREKGRVLGVWTTTDSAKFDDVPSYYELAASNPLAKLAAPALLFEKQIGIDNIPALNTNKNTHFIPALISLMEQKQLFVAETGTLSYPGPMLFKAKFSLPAIVSPGEYKVSAFVFQDGAIVEERGTAFVVRPEGTSASLHQFATTNGLLYGITGMLLAVIAGWLATVLLKRD